MIHREPISPLVSTFSIEFAMVVGETEKRYVATSIQAFSASFSSDPSAVGPGVYVIVSEADRKEFFTVLIEFD